MKRVIPLALLILLLPLNYANLGSVQSIDQEPINSSEIITGFQNTKIDGLINDFTSSQYLTEWADAHKEDIVLKGSSGSELGMTKYIKFIQGQLYVAGNIPTKSLLYNNLRQIALQIDMDTNSKLSNGDLQLRTEIVGTKLNTGNPLLDTMKFSTINVFQDNVWQPISGMIKDSNYVATLQSIEISPNERLGSTQFEIQFSYDEARSILRELGYNVDQSKATELVPMNIDLSIEDNNGQFFTRNDYKIIDSKSESIASLGYTNYYHDFKVPALNSIDVGTNKIEVIQVVQNEAGDLPVVQDKETLVRVYVDNPTSAAQEVEVTLKGWKLQPGSFQNLGELSTTFTAPVNADVDRLVYVDTANFELPMNWVDYDFLILKAEVRIINSIDLNSGNNDMWKGINLVKTQDLNIYRLPINDGTVSSPSLPTTANMDKINDYLEMAYPTNPNFINIGWETVGAFSRDGTDDGDELIADLNEVLVGLILSIAFGASMPLPDQIHATTDWGGGLSDPEWWNNGLGFTSWGSIGATSQELVAAHEINHNILPTPTAYHIGGCGADYSDNIWNATYGELNTEINDLGWNPSDGLIQPTKDDYMSYCNEWADPAKWVSAYRWQVLVDRLSSWTSGQPNPLVLDQVQLDQTAPSNFAVINGHFNNPNKIKTTYFAELNPTFTVPGAESKLLSNFLLPAFDETKPYQMIIKYADGTSIAGSVNGPDFSDLEGTTEFNQKSFTFVVPADKAIQSIEFQTLKGDPIAAPLINNAIGASDAKFSAQFLADGVVKRGTPYDLSITHSMDSKSTGLYRLQYTPDAGKSWYPIGQSIEGTDPTGADLVFPIMFDQLPGSVEKGSSQLRLLVTNGLTTVIHNSPYFHVDPLNPEVHIKASKQYDEIEVKSETGLDQQISGRTVQTQVGSTVSFVATAKDQQGNPLAVDDIGWVNSPVDGKLSIDQTAGFSGSSTYVHKFNKPGIYTVNVEVKDQFGLTATDSILVNVTQSAFTNAEIYNEFVKALDDQRSGYNTGITETSSSKTSTTSSTSTSSSDQSSTSKDTTSESSDGNSSSSIATPQVPVSTTTIFITIFLAIPIVRRQISGSKKKDLLRSRKIT